MREKWGHFGAILPMTKEAVQSALTRAANASELIKKMGEFFHTNALVRSGVMEMMDSIIQEKVTKVEDSSFKEEKKVLKRKVKRF